MNDMQKAMIPMKRKKDIGDYFLGETLLRMIGSFCSEQNDWIIPGCKSLWMPSKECAFWHIRLLKMTPQSDFSIGDFSGAPTKQRVTYWSSHSEL
jgi:hypothetical protein